MKRLLITLTLFIALAAMLYSYGGQARAASDPPQVGDRQTFYLKTTDKTATWTKTVLKDGAAYANLSSTFTNQSTFSPGAFTMLIPWHYKGSYVLKCHPSVGSDVTYAVDVVDKSQEGIYAAVADIPTNPLLTTDSRIPAAAPPTATPLAPSPTRRPSFRSAG